VFDREMRWQRVGPECFALGADGRQRRSKGTDQDCYGDVITGETAGRSGRPA
jgi:hypothetical protein